MRLLTIFLLWPLAEIALFVTLGGRIGLAATLLVIVATAMLGMAVLRSSGVRSAREVQHGMRIMGGGLGQAADQVLLMLAGLLLVLPGFLTDILGGLLLIAPLRRAVILWTGRRVTAGRAGPQAGFDRHPRRGDIVIDGEFVESDGGVTFKTINPATEEVLSEIAEADEADVGEQLQAQPDIHFFARPAHAMLARRPVGGAFIAGIAAPAIATAQKDNAFARLGKVGQHMFFVFRDDLRANGHPDNQIFAACACTVAARTI